jgi:hypothetical protein
MSSDLRLALDPALLGEKVDLTLDPWQADLMRKVATHGLHAILLASWQVGKSTAAILCALWAALFDPGLILSWRRRCGSPKRISGSSWSSTIASISRRRWSRNRH